MKSLAKYCLRMLLGSFLFLAGSICFAQMPLDSPSSPSISRRNQLVNLGSEVILHSEDGLRLEARYRQVKGSTQTVILVPMLANPVEGYAELMNDLANAGMSSLAFDLRGQWSTAMLNMQNTETVTSKPRKLVSDIDAAVKYARSTGQEVEQIVGAGIGANASLVYSTGDPRIKRLMLFSPVSKFLEQDTLQSSGSLVSAQTVLIVTGNKDAASTTFSLTLARSLKALGVPVRRLVSNVPFHGSALLIPVFRDNWVQWLRTGSMEIPDYVTESME